MTVNAFAASRLPVVRSALDCRWQARGACLAPGRHWRRAPRTRATSRAVIAGLFDAFKPLFGDGENDRAQNKQLESQREREIAEQQRIMREKLEARRAGRHLEGVAERRQAVQEQLNAKEKPKPGEDPLIAWERQREKERTAGTWKEVGYGEEPKRGIILPWPSFGIPRFDYGERFDLRLPYVDEGYVDEDADIMGKIFGRRRKPPESQRSPENGDNGTNAASE
jgi:hypothetical protein